MLILSTSRTVNSSFSGVSVLNVKSIHSSRFREMNNSREEVENHLCRICHQIMIPPFTQAPICVRCYGKGLVLDDAHPNIFDRRCFMAERRAMKRFLSVPLYIIFVSPLAKAVFLPQCMFDALTANALAHVIPVRSDEPDKLDRQELDITTHVDREWGKQIKQISQLEIKPHISTERKR